jgi:hypothetical protein|tara:strand:+ start:384 stop:566 length:183 start_codon:yes stop_codon:yes gene_type:complete
LVRAKVRSRNPIKDRSWDASINLFGINTVSIEGSLTFGKLTFANKLDIVTTNLLPLARAL